MTIEPRTKWRIGIRARVATETACAIGYGFNRPIPPIAQTELLFLLKLGLTLHALSFLFHRDGLSELSGLVI